jgi:hypothetical protein
MRRLAVVVLAVVALAGCGDSPEDEARDSGEEIGEAAQSLSKAASPADAQKALAELRDEVGDLDVDVRDKVADQVAVQRKTLESAVGGGTDALQAAVQQMQAQAAAFREGESSIANEFWRGVQEGYEGD